MSMRRTSSPGGVYTWRRSVCPPWASYTPRSSIRSSPGRGRGPSMPSRCMAGSVAAARGHRADVVGHNHRDVLAVVKDSAAPGFQVREVEEPRPRAGELLLRVAATSVCGTDVPLYDCNAWAAARVTPPRIVGHEVCGEVIGWGEGVSRPAIGTRVAVESHIVCGHCDECRRGDFHVCENTRILGVHVDGAFAATMTVPLANVWPVGDSVAPEVAAAMEPFGNAVRACSC